MSGCSPSSAPLPALSNPLPVPVCCGDCAAQVHPYTPLHTPTHTPCPAAALGSPAELPRTNGAGMRGALGAHSRTHTSPRGAAWLPQTGPRQGDAHWKCLHTNTALQAAHGSRSRTHVGWCSPRAGARQCRHGGGGCSPRAGRGRLPAQAGAGNSAGNAAGLAGQPWLAAVGSSAAARSFPLPDRGAPSRDQ